MRERARVARTDLRHGVTSSFRRTRSTPLPCCNDGVNEPCPEARVDVRGALGMFVVGVVLIGIGLAETWSDAIWHLSPRWWHVAPLAVMCALMGYRRIHPLTCLGLGTLVFVAEGLAGGSLGSLLVFIELAHAAGRYARGRDADRVGALIVPVIVGFGVLTLVLTRDLRAAVLVALTVFAVFGTSYWWGESARKQADLIEVERARAADLARMADLREEQARRSEREAMAGELHDALSGNLAAITIHAEAALVNPRLAPQALTLVRATSKQAMGELRSLLAVLRPSDDAVIAPSRVEDAVEAARARGVDVRVSYAPDPLGDLPRPVAHAAYRVLQEALTNVQRHSADARADVEIHAGDELSLVVRSGAPMDAADPGRGYGLTSMAERVRALGGHLVAGPDDGGWRVDSRIPLLPPHHDEGRPR